MGGAMHRLRFGVSTLAFLTAIPAAAADAGELGGNVEVDASELHERVYSVSAERLHATLVGSRLEVEANLSRGKPRDNCQPGIWLWRQDISIDRNRDRGWRFRGNPMARDHVLSADENSSRALWFVRLVGERRDDSRNLEPQRMH